ncbi:nonsense-mediated decay protein [Aureococcus anophagefferens]|uniref:Nonsense-mediated decay protein n=1 Tax=Aureococcus anophagefferens TaxID=44056 RepID=A0ABR1FQZ1_AURAN
MQIAALGAGATALQLPRRNFLGATAATVAAPRIAAAAELEIPSAVAPSWTLLIPIVELDAAVARWTVDVGAKSTSSVASALELLNKGGILSSKNFYLGVGTKYATSLVYDDFDKKLVEQDKNARLGDFLARAPRKDVEKARNALASLVAADANGDGQVDDAEFYKAGALSTETLAATL